MNLVLRSRLVVLLAFASLLGACDMVSDMADSSTHAGPIESEIEAVTGNKPDVFSAGNGPILVVIVQFSQVPSLPVSSLEPIVRAAIVREFRKEPTALTISFVYQKQWPFER